MESPLKHLERMVKNLIIIFLLSISISSLQKSCVNTSSKQVVTIPAKVGSFKDSIQYKEVEKVRESLVYVKGKEVKVENPVNKELLENFIQLQKENDSLKLLKLYVKAIEEREGNYTFNNEDMDLNIYTNVRGTILNIKPTYKIKERVLEVREKETVFASYAGLSLGTTTDLTKLTPSLDLGIQNKSGDIFTGSVGLDKTIKVGYFYRFINIKK